MKAPAYLFLIGLLMGLSGCARMQSSVRHEDVPPIKRILVVTKTRAERDAYARSFQPAFPAHYKICTLASHYADPQREETIRRRAKLCRSDAILLVEAVGGGNVLHYTTLRTNTRRHQRADKALFHVAMRSATDPKPFWRTMVRAHPALGEQLPPRAVVTRLLRDGVIEGPLPPPAPSATAMAE